MAGGKITQLCCYHFPRSLLAGIFIYSGVVKLADVKNFARLISQYDLVPDPFLAPVAVGLPVLEFLAGVGLLFEIPGALTAIFGMLLFFCTILWYGILKNLDIDCGCFSSAELKGHAGLRKALYRDFFMIAVCGSLYFYRFLRFKRQMIAGLPVFFRKII